jgi:hypothetical protein
MSPMKQLFAIRTGRGKAQTPVIISPHPEDLSLPFDSLQYLEVAKRKTGPSNVTNRDASEELNINITAASPLEELAEQARHQLRNLCHANSGTKPYEPIHDERLVSAFSSIENCEEDLQMVYYTEESWVEPYKSSVRPSENACSQSQLEEWLTDSPIILVDSPNSSPIVLTRSFKTNVTLLLETVSDSEIGY